MEQQASFRSQLFIFAILALSLSEFASAQPYTCYNSTSGTVATGCTSCTITVTSVSSVLTYTFGCSSDPTPAGSTLFTAATATPVIGSGASLDKKHCAGNNCNFYAVTGALGAVTNCNSGSTPSSGACPSGICAIQYSTSATSGARSYTYTCSATQCGGTSCSASATVFATNAGFTNALADNTYYCYNADTTACNRLNFLTGITCLSGTNVASVQCPNTDKALVTATACSVTQTTSSGVRSFTYQCNTENTCKGTINSVTTLTGLAMGSDGTYCCTSVNGASNNHNCNFIKSTTSGAAEGAVVRTAFATNALLFVSLAVARMLNL